MKNQTKLKSAVITSIVAMFLSIILLFGTTFAWFTDSVTNVNNVIKTGNLDVELWHCSCVDAMPTGFGYVESKGEKVDESTSLFLNQDGKQILWEPGAQVGETFRIKNMGTLALKYEFKIRNYVETQTEQADKLSEILNLEAIELEYNEVGTPYTPQNGYTYLDVFGEGHSVEGTLHAGESIDYWIGIDWTPSDKDNNYNVLGGLSMRFGIELVATQTSYEKDGLNGDDYDAKAEYPTLPDVWTGEVDTSWYDENADKYYLDSAEALAGMRQLVDGGETFADKTIYLDTDVNLYAEDENGEAICFDPIGSYRHDKIFSGTFDGQGHTISNLSQNTWALNNGYYYGDLGLGLFGAVLGAHIKDVSIDGAEISGESALCGTIAAVAENTTFENITVKNANVADYQYYSGGIVGWASGKIKVINCNIDESTTIGAQWGEFNNANGGVIGGTSSDADTEISLKDCTIACRIDAFNDVTSAYEWYSYRRSGMIIGDTGCVDDPNGDNIGNAIAPQLICENVTVIYEEWADYHYCQFGNMSYPWVRVEGGTSTGEYSNPRYGHPTDANGNEVVDDNHVHNDGEKHHELIVFDQLYGGVSGHRYCTYGTATHDGVTVVYNNASKKA